MNGYIIIIGVLLIAFLCLKSRLSIVMQLTYRQTQVCINWQVYITKRVCLYRGKSQLRTLSSEENATILSVKEKISGRPPLRRKRKGLRSLKDFYQYHVKNLVYYTSLLLRYLRIDKWRWHIQLGGENPALTSILCGVLCAIHQQIVRTITKHTHLACQPKVNVIPVFNKATCFVQGECIASIQVGNLIYVLWQIVLAKRTRRKILWRNIPFRA